ncbi:VOC family protein [Pseudarthrobacter sp. J75]|uniref:VOC family protein n=1 Tax=unclassified Pseudarthrobacter TaxID=2647000 RepID=UPI002E81B6BD|nr:MULTISPECIES: VOC family protein [unclassified Pseudarthrobacter]MEE2523152.1 VOC family protein [Pseudarthrobacter sp. J47]MEE2529836.1 VOC family protein [Pseudarthrobacter sp. J75]
MEKITTCLWFKSEAEEAAGFYTSVFDDSEVRHVARQGNGEVLTVDFTLGGRSILALNGSRGAEFSEAFSLVVHCESQDELDRYWDALVADGGQESMCGWLKDRFGLSWQIVPTVLGSLIGGPDPEGAQRAVQAMLGMRKLDIATLQKAYDGGEN